MGNSFKLIKRKEIKIKEAVVKLGIDELDIIHAAADGSLKLYLFATVEVASYFYGEGGKMRPVSEKPVIEKISVQEGFFPVPKYFLNRLKAEEKTLITSLEVGELGKKIQEEHCKADDTKGLIPHHFPLASYKNLIGKEDLFVFTTDIEAYEKQKAEAKKNENERTNLLSLIGALTTLYWAKINKNYTGKAINQSIVIGDIVEKFPKVRGLSKRTLEAKIKEGLDFLNHYVGEVKEAGEANKIVEK